jgi:hypothetical protein
MSDEMMPAYSNRSVFCRCYESLTQLSKMLPKEADVQTHMFFLNTFGNAGSFAFNSYRKASFIWALKIFGKRTFFLK